MVVADDAFDRRPRGDDVAQRTDEVKHGELRARDRSAPDTSGARHRDEPCGTFEHRRERQPRCTRDAGRIVEQLAQQEADACGLSRGPADECECERVELDREPLRVDGVVERPGRDLQLVRELRADPVEHGAVELLLASEVIDDRRERKMRDLGDVAHARAVEAMAREERFRTDENSLARTFALRRLAPAVGEIDHRKPYDRTRKTVRVYGKRPTCRAPR